MSTQTRFATVGLVALLLGVAAAADDATQTMHAGALTFEAPKDWKPERPSNAMRKAQVKVPATKGDTEDAELVVTAFPGGAGSVDANIKRWEGQFTGEGGKAPKAKVDKKKGKNVEVTRVEVSGKYGGMAMPGQPKAEAKGDYRLLGAIVETPEVSYFFKLTGPDKTVDGTSKAFDKLVESMTLEK